MKIQVHSPHVRLTDGLMARITDALHAVVPICSVGEDARADVSIEVSHREHRISTTVRGKRVSLHAAASDLRDMYSAISVMELRLKRQARKKRTQQLQSRRATTAVHGVV